MSEQQQQRGAFPLINVIATAILFGMAAGLASYNALVGPHFNQRLVKDVILVQNDASGENGREHQRAIKPKLKFAIATISALFFGALSGFFLSRALNQERIAGTMVHLFLSFGSFCVAAVAVFWAQVVWFERW